MMKCKAYAARALGALSGIFFIGTGVAFNAMAHLGNDPVGIFYDGIRNTMGLNQAGLGLASNLVNVGFLCVLFFIGRKYLNVGTLIYILPYGTCVSAGTWLYSKIFLLDTIPVRILASAAGCLLLYFGVGIFIAVDIGMDPMTGMAMVIRDRLGWDFKRGKWLLDGTITIVGFVLGGKLGIVTIVTALSAGPAIQWIAEHLTGMGKGRKENALPENRTTA